jgi:PST family polysaccharide transporter
LVFSVPFLFTYFAFGHNYIALTEKRVIAGKITVAISVSCLGLALLLIPLSGVIGFAAIMVIARGSMALMGFLLFKQHRRETYSPRMTGL